MDDAGGVAVVARFPGAWEAELAMRYLEDEGIPAWLDVPTVEDPARRQGIRVLVPADRADEARAVLAEVEEAPPEDEEPAPSRGFRRPVWVVAVAALVAGAMIVAAVPRSLWVPLLVIALFALIFWRAIGPRTPG